MKTEDVQLDIKAIFEGKKVRYCRCDIARMRHLCKGLVGLVIEFERNNGQTKNKGDLPMENRSEGTETIRVR